MSISSAGAVIPLRQQGADPASFQLRRAEPMVSGPPDGYDIHTGGKTIAGGWYRPGLDDGPPVDYVPVRYFPGIANVDHPGVSGAFLGNPQAERYPFPYPDQGSQRATRNTVLMGLRQTTGKWSNVQGRAAANPQVGR